MVIIPALLNWQPFRIDALGLVTMIGAEEVDHVVGRLISNPVAEYLPLLGAFMVAGDRFVQPIPGFVLYNISDGIMATDVAGWLSRWLKMQQSQWNTTTFEWHTMQTARPFWEGHVLACLLATMVNVSLVILPVLIGDRFGTANSVALVISVFVRWYLIKQNRDFLDLQVSECSGEDSKRVKLICLMADGRAVTMHAPRGFVKRGFLTIPRPSRCRLYRVARWLGWTAFGCHVICIDQATLFVQIVTVLVMIGATVATVTGSGSNELSLCRRIHLTRSEPLQGDDSRTLAYARLKLTLAEESTMLAWSLLPQPSNQSWWDQYQRLKLSLEIQSANTKGKTDVTNTITKV